MVLPDGSGVSREAPAPFCDGLAGKFRRSTHHKLHWVLDVQFKEDNDQKAERKSTRSFALLRRIALNIVRTRDTTPKRSVRRKLKRSGWDNNYLKDLLLNS